MRRQGNARGQAGNCAAGVVTGANIKRALIGARIILSRVTHDGANPRAAARRGRRVVVLGARVAFTNASPAASRNALAGLGRCAPQQGYAMMTSSFAFTIFSHSPFSFTQFFV